MPAGLPISEDASEEPRPTNRSFELVHLQRDSLPGVEGVGARYLGGRGKKGAEVRDVVFVDLIRHSPDAIQIRGNRTTVPPPKELHPFRSHPMV